MRAVITMSVAAAVVLLGCQDSVGPVAPRLSANPAAAVGSAGLKAPSNAGAATMSETQIAISWQDNSPNEDGFEVHRSITGGPAFFFIATTRANVLTYRNEGLSPGTTYCYQVRAVRKSASLTMYSAFSNTACATTLAPPPPPPPPPPLPPASASGTTAVPAYSTDVGISWTDNSSNEDGFHVDRSADGGVVWGRVATAGANSNSIYLDAMAELPICYRVVAFNAGGEAPASNAACTTPPAGPTNLTATRVDAVTVELTWDDNSAFEDGYEVWEVECTGLCNSDGSTIARLIAVLPPNSTLYRGADISSGYWVWVVARKDGGYSDDSNGVFAP